MNLNLIGRDKKESVVSAIPILIMSSLSDIANDLILFIINTVSMNTLTGLQENIFMRFS